MMNEIVKDLSTTSLIHAIKANLYAFFRYFSRSTHTEFYESPKYIRWHTRVEHPWFNGVLSTQAAADNEEQTIQEVLSYFRSRKVNEFIWWFEPQLQATAWEEHLKPHGFQYDNSTPGMAVDLALLPASVPHPKDLLIRCVEDLETLQEWTRTFNPGYELPSTFFSPFLELATGWGFDLPLRHYLAYLNGTPVATSSLFLSAGVAGIYYVATLPEARGQGIGTFLTLIPLHQAREMGYRAGVLQSSEMGYRVYQRLGFQKLCDIEIFYWQPEKREAAGP